MATITGSNADDTLTGTAGNDLLLGLDGNDMFIASDGNDTLDGGSWWIGLGHNVASYAAQSSAVVADLRLGRATVGNAKLDTLITITALRGGSGDDQLTGNAFANLLDGGAGNDVLRGLEGDDVIAPWVGNDTVDGGDGNDTLRLLPWSGPVVVDLALGRMSLGAWTSVLSGIETVESGAGNDSMVGSDADNVLMAGDGHNTLRGGLGADALVAGAGNDLLEGGAGDDYLYMGAGNNTLDGGAGRDTVDYSFARGGPGVRVSLADGTASGANIGNDVLTGIEVVIGSGGSDRLEGSAGDDSLTSVGGQATLLGGAGNDDLLGGILLDGGDGNDYLSTTTAGAQLFGGKGDDTLEGGLAGSLDGGAGDDTFMGIPAAAQGAVVDGGPGFDSLQLPYRDSGGDVLVTINLASGSYSLGGNPGNPAAASRLSLRSIEALYDSKGWSSTFIGDDADNRLVGDIVIGGGGNDTLEGGVADYADVALPILVRMEGQDRPALVFVGGDTDSVSTFRLALGTGDDVMQGPRQLSGRWAFGEVMGRAGNDLLRGETVNGGAGDDTLNGSVASYRDAPGPVAASIALQRASGADGNDTFVEVRGLIGTAFADTLDGGEGNDTIVGGSGSALIRGGAGDDTLGGGGGNDTILGGAGNDFIPFSRGNQQLDGGDGFDRLGGEHYPSDLYQLDREAEVVINLRERTMTLSFEGGVKYDSQVSGFELVDLRDLDYLALKLVGLDGPAEQRGEWFIHGFDIGSLRTRSIDGGSGIDTLVIRDAQVDYGTTSAYLLQASVDQPGALRIARGVPLGETPRFSLELRNVERIQFSNSLLAFGDRALEVAKVAFALWSPAIAPSATLFGKGVDWYDDGHSYRELIDFALTYFSGLSDAQLAQTLRANVQSTRSQSEVLGLITQQGRAAATQLVADDAANMAQIELAGLKSSGIECALMFGSEALFVMPG